MGSSFSRRVIGLIAAYAIALQTLLGVALPLHAGASPGEICVGRSDPSSPTSPAHDADLQCCAAMGCQGEPLIGPQDVSLILARHPDRAAQTIAGPIAFVDVPLSRPNWPRAPPLG